MIKLTRYKSFEELKLSAKSSNGTCINNKEQVSELEAFLNLLRNELSMEKKTKKSKNPDG
jgi:hypothetical protein